MAIFLASVRDGESILEIGCSSGTNLARFAAKAEVTCAGIDPSSEAVRAGKEQYPDFDLRVGTADILPFDDASFDLVLFGFCLYLADRPDLPRIVSEGDRVLRDGGRLGIVDFDPPYPMRRDYNHLAGVSSYKMDYTSLFLAFPQYSLAEKVSMSGEGPGFHSDPNERVSAAMLSKNLTSGYAG